MKEVEPQPWCRSQLWLGFAPWLRNCVPWAARKKTKERKEACFDAGGDDV